MAKRQLTEAELAQRRAAALRAGAVSVRKARERREAGFTPKRRIKLTESEKILSGPRVFPDSRSTQLRKKQFTVQQADNDFRQIKRELTREAREANNRFQENLEDFDLALDREQANLRVFQQIGLFDTTSLSDVDFRWIAERRLQEVSWDNRGLQSFLRKYRDLQKKGYTRHQIQQELDRRLFKLLISRGDNLNPGRMLQLVQEFYKSDKLGRTHRISHLKPRAKRLGVRNAA